MNNSEISTILKEKFGNKILEISEPYDLLTVTVSKDSILEIIRWLASDDGLRFSFLTDLTGIHYPEQKGEELGVIYHLQNMRENIRIRIKIFVSSQNPQVLSLTPVFQSANWMERETFDFYGIQFQGHTNLKRILNMEEMDYFPMRKEYPLEDQKREDKEDKYFGR
jgi:NADH-quinone oxidoreductase subunit C